MMTADGNDSAPTPVLRPDRTLGPGHDRFWDYCAREELWLPRCDGCGKLHWPVIAACDACGHGAMTWQQLSGEARLVAWNVFHKDYYKGILPVPYLTILVELAEGPLFMSNPAGLEEADLAPGMALSVRFIPGQDSAGAFKLPVFGRP